MPYKKTAKKVAKRKAVAKRIKPALKPLKYIYALVDNETGKNIMSYDAPVTVGSDYNVEGEDCTKVRYVLESSVRPGGK